MKIGILAGNRNLPILLAKRINRSNKFEKIVGVCFKGETSLGFSKYVDRCLWVEVGKLANLKKAIESQGIKNWVMAGQISPANIFKEKKWDNQLKKIIRNKVDFCPHNIFKAIIEYLQEGGVKFLDSTFYLRDDLAGEGVTNNLNLSENLKDNIEFGLRKISKFVEVDIGQTLVVKNNAVVAAESLEGTDNTIKRGFRLAGRGVSVFKFAKRDQDLRFDVPVVGLSTLKLLKRIRASLLVLEKDKVIILNKEKFLRLSRAWKIPVVGAVLSREKTKKET